MVEIGNIIASLLILGGGFLLARNFFFRRKTAFELGVSRISGSTDEENLKLPMVQFFLRARRDAVLGFVLIVIGISIQIILEINS